MKKFKITFIHLIAAFVIFSCSSDDSNTPDNPNIESLNPLESYEAIDVTYGSDSDQVFDIYLPANRSLETKTLILVHGGGWTSGDKEDMQAFVTIIKQDLPDLAIVNINYRLADETTQPYPMQINDITAIINQLKTDAEIYTISQDFGFVGLSAGAHLALLWSYAFDVEDNISMVSSIVGPTNFTDPAYLNAENPDLQELIELYGLNPTTEFLEDISPYHQVTSQAPPTILFYGGQDPLIPTSQGTDMQEKLLELSVIHEFTLYQDEGHGWVGLNLLDTWSKLKLFINNYL
jgi:acetyl esterase/lipase